MEKQAAVPQCAARVKPGVVFTSANFFTWLEAAGASSSWCENASTRWEAWPARALLLYRHRQFWHTLKHGSGTSATFTVEGSEQQLTCLRLWRSNCCLRDCRVGLCPYNCHPGELLFPSALAVVPSPWGPGGECMWLWAGTCLYMSALTGILEAVSQRVSLQVWLFSTGQNASLPGNVDDPAPKGMSGSPYFVQFHALLENSLQGWPLGRGLMNWGTRWGLLCSCICPLAVKKLCFGVKNVRSPLSVSASASERCAVHAGSIHRRSYCKASCMGWRIAAPLGRAL